MDINLKLLRAQVENLEDEIATIAACTLGPKQHAPDWQRRLFGDPVAKADLHGRLDAAVRTLALLSTCLVAPKLPTRVRKHGLRRLVSPQFRGNTDSAKRARIGRAARREGITFDEWVDRYGFVEQVPQANDASVDASALSSPPNHRVGPASSSDSTSSGRLS